MGSMQPTSPTGVYIVTYRASLQARKNERKVYAMKSLTNSLAIFFGVAVRGQTYLNALYLFLAFPLGLFYFIFLVTGLSLGVSLVIVWVGIFLLLIVFAIWYALLIFERQMAISMLHEDIPPITRENDAGKTNWQKLKSALANPVTWKGLLYLLAKFPIGIISFVVLVTLLTLSFTLLAAPLYYQWVHPQVSVDFGYTLSNSISNSIWAVDTLTEALLASFAGLLLFFISLHIFNALAWVSGKFARVMLGDFRHPMVSPLSTAPTAPEPQVESGTPPSPESTVPTE